jgi:hypothetical protein
MSMVEKLVGLGVFTAACFASFVAYGTYSIMCIHYEGSEACLGRETEFAMYLALSVAGLVAAGLMLHFAFRGPRKAFVALLIAALALFAASVPFADAGTRGWDNLKVVPTPG